jgi:hypothetical protein
MPKKLREILEMANPAPEHHGMMFYHGTSDESHAQSILQSGHIKAPDYSSGGKHSARGFMTPMKGSTYVTPHLHYAQIYGIGGDIAGTDHHNIKGEHGYVFGVHGKHLKDIHPDEDSLGEFVSKHTKLGYSYKDQPTFHNPTGEHDAEKRSLWSALRTHMTDNQFRKSAHGEYAYWAAGGKRANKHLSDHHKLLAIKHGAHIAHSGDLPITKAWRIHKSKVPLLKRDGSNFFDHAEEVPIK